MLPNYLIHINTCAGPTKNWIAVEGSTSSAAGGGGFGGGSNRSPSAVTAMETLQPFNYKIASSAPRVQSVSTEDRNVFAIYVSYYIKVKLTLSAMGGEVTLKLPFILGHVDDGDHQQQQRTETKPDVGDIVVTTATTTTGTVMLSTPANSNNCQQNTLGATLDDIVVAVGAADAAAAGTPLSIDDITTTTSSNLVDVAATSATSVSTAPDQTQCRRHSSNNRPNRTAETKAESCRNIVTAQVHYSAM